MTFKLDLLNTGVKGKCYISEDEIGVVYQVDDITQGAEKVAVVQRACFYFDGTPITKLSSGGNEPSKTKSLTSCFGDLSTPQDFKIEIKKPNN